MRILVTFAMDAEFAPWRKLRKFRDVKFNDLHWTGGYQVQATEINGHEILVYFTGMGIKSFDFGVASCMKDGGVATVISSGLAGSLRPDLVPSAVLSPRRVGTLRDATGIPLSEKLLELAEQRGASVIDTLLSSDHIIDTPQEKGRLSEFGEAVDMESFHVARAFTDERIPVVVIRSVSDGSGDKLPIDFSTCLTPAGKIKVVPLLKNLAKSPNKVRELIRFGRQSRAATEKLIAFLNGYIAAVSPGIINDKPLEAVS
jgi:nucleoside phosphorylase